jgi:CRISPR/Cas system-associated exonuclease Cas4 (RecB family)
MIQEQVKSKQIPIPEKIITFLKSQNGERKFRKDTYSVTELTNCLRNTFYKKNRFPTEVLSSNISELWSTVRGNMLHKLANAYSWNELEGEIEITLDNGKKITVCGRLDMYDPETKTIIDIKTTNGLEQKIANNELPNNDHIFQIQSYGTIFSKIIPVDHLNLVYVDNSQITTFEVSLENNYDWIKHRVSILESSMESMKMPTAEIGSKCKFCRYQKLCSKN